MFSSALRGMVSSAGGGGVKTNYLGGYDPTAQLMQNPMAMGMMQQGYRPVFDQSGRLSWMPPMDPEAGLPTNLRMANIQEAMGKAKNADKQKYMNETVNPALSQARAQMLSMGNRGSFGAQQLADITRTGNDAAENFGEEASSRAFGNLVNLRQQYLSGRGMAQQEQDRQYGSLTDALSMQRQQQQLLNYGTGGSGSGGSDFKSGLSDYTQGRALMQGIQGISNFAAKSPTIQNAYKQGGLMGVLGQVPRAAGQILFGL